MEFSDINGLSIDLENVEGIFKEPTELVEFDPAARLDIMKGWKNGITEAMESAYVDCYRESCLKGWVSMSFDATYDKFKVIIDNLEIDQPSDNVKALCEKVYAERSKPVLVT